jgi:hypothetical protein
MSALGGASLARALAVNRTVTALDLRWNALRSAGAEALAAALRVNATLTVVRVCGNAMGDAGVTALAAALTDNTSVREWTAGDNDVGDAGGSAVFRMLETNTTLKVVHLKRHTMGATGPSVGRALAAMLAVNRTLERLDVSGHKYTWDDAASDIASAAAANPGLVLVDGF